MKKNLSSVTLMIALAAFALLSFACADAGSTNTGESAKTNSNAANSNAQAAANAAATSTQSAADAEKELTQIERDLAAAFVRGDTSVIEQHTDKDAYLVDPMGDVSSRSNLVEQIKSGDLKFESIEPSDIKVRTYGDTAVVSYQSKEKGKYKTQDIGGETRWLEVFVRRNGKWQVVASQGTVIGQPPAAATKKP